MSGIQHVVPVIIKKNTNKGTDMTQKWCDEVTANNNLNCQQLGEMQVKLSKENYTSTKLHSTFNMNTNIKHENRHSKSK